MDKLKAGDYSGPTMDESRYLRLRDEPVVGNPRQSEEYQKKCLEAVGVGETLDRERYKHLSDDDSTSSDG